MFHIADPAYLSYSCILAAQMYIAHKPYPSRLDMQPYLPQVSQYIIGVPFRHWPSC